MLQPDLQGKRNESLPEVHKAAGQATPVPEVRMLHEPLYVWELGWRFFGRLSLWASVLQIAGLVLLRFSFNPVPTDVMEHYDGTGEPPLQVVMVRYSKPKLAKIGWWLILIGLGLRGLA